MTDTPPMTHRHGCPLPGLRASVVGDLCVIRCAGCGAVAVQRTQTPK